MMFFLRSVSRLIPCLTIVSIMAMLAACTTPYANPEFDEIGFNDTDKPKVLPFDGILNQAAGGDLRVVWLHGMCKHKRTWAETRYSIISRALNLPPQDGTRVPGEGKAYTVLFNSKLGRHDLEMRYLIWSPLADDAKVAIAESDADSPPDFAPTRAHFNAKLKRKLMNDCLSDAVIYTGSAGDEIRRWLRIQVCEAIDGRMVDERHCIIPSNASRRKTIFVAESLGSKMLADALLSIWNLAGPTGKARIEEQLADVQSVFFLANQIPLLNAATYGAPRSGSKSFASGDEEVELLGLFAKARNRSRGKLLDAAPSAPMHFVSFWDPNDLLSYRLLRGRDSVPDGVRVTNVLVSNAPTYLGLLELPDAAHCGYGWNAAVIGIVTKGYRGRVEKIPLRIPHECGLGEEEEKVAENG
jgi:hypothetical protein